MNIPNDRRYTSDHIWVKANDGCFVVGITENAQDALGMIEAIHLPPVGARLAAGAVCGSIESLKTASDLIAPLDGLVLTHNESTLSDPGKINTQPYGDGWLLTMSPASQSTFEELLDANAYARLVG